MIATGFRLPTATFVVLAVGAGGASAQLPLDLRGERVVAVEIRGDTAGITPERELGIPIGVPVTRQLIRAALDRLSQSGRWADAQIDLVRAPGGVRVIAHLVPRVLVARVEVRGNEVLGDGELLRAIELATGDELKPRTRWRLAEAISEAYRERGYERARSQILVRDTDDPTRKVVIVQIVEGPPTHIVHLQFEGEAPPAASGASEALRIGVGDVLDRRALQRSVRAAETRMRDRGWLEARLDEPVVAYDDRGGAIVSIPARPGPLYRVQVIGHQPLERGDVDDILAIGEERLSPAALDGVRDRVVDFYLRHGFLDAEVDVDRVLGPDPGTARIVVSIRPGAQIDIVSISFPGTRHYDEAFMREQLYSYLQEDLPGSVICAHSPWSRCRSRSPVDTETVDGLLADSELHRREVRRPLVVDARRIYYEPTYEEALSHVTELLQAEGYLSARVGPARLARLEGDHAAVEIPVVEGPRTTLHRVIVQGNDVMTSREVLEAAGLERGQPFSHLSLEQGRLLVVEAYGERGHLYARVEPTVRYSADRTRAEVILEIVEGVEVRVGEISVDGAEQTSEALIRDRLTFGPGDLYRPSAARRSQERLLELGIFSAVNISPQDADLPAPVKPVVITVTERSWGFLELAAGFSTGEGLRGGFDFGIRNVGGYAIGFNIGIRAAFQFFFLDDEVRRRFEALSAGDRIEGRVTLGATLPHLPGLPYWRLSVDTGFFQDNERDFGINRYALSTTATWRPIREFSVRFTPGVERNDVTLFVDEDLDEFLRMNTDPRLERLLRVPEGRSWLAFFGNTVAVDLRDNPFNTTRGFFAAIESEYARTLSAEQQVELDEPFESNFIKIKATSSGYVPLSDKLVLAAQVQTGRVFHLTDASRTYPNRAFFLGGVDTMRGYLQDAMIPQDVAEQIIADDGLQPNDVVRRGDTFFLVRGELRFNIPVAEWLWGGLFTEFGNLWADPAELDPIDLRPSAGAGLRIETPVGPLAFDFGFLLDPRDELDENPWAFHFSIGLF